MKYTCTEGDGKASFKLSESCQDHRLLVSLARIIFSFGMAGSTCVTTTMIALFTQRWKLTSSTVVVTLVCQRTSQTQQRGIFFTRAAMNMALWSGNWDSMARRVIRTRRYTRPCEPGADRLCEEWAHCITHRLENSHLFTTPSTKDLSVECHTTFVLEGTTALFMYIFILGWCTLLALRIILRGYIYLDTSMIPLTR